MKVPRTLSTAAIADACSFSVIVLVTQHPTLNAQAAAMLSSNIAAQIPSPATYFRGLNNKSTRNKQFVKEATHLASFSNAHSCRPARQQHKRVIMQQHTVVANAGLGFGKAGAIDKSKQCPCGSGLLYKVCSSPPASSSAGINTSCIKASVNASRAQTCSFNCVF